MNALAHVPWCMGQRCLVCTHPKRDAINRELLQAKSSLADIAERHGMSKSAVDRHKANHLKVSLVAASEAKNALTIVGYASDLYERAGRVLERAEGLLAGEDMDARGVQAAAASLREVRGSIELLAKLVVSAPDAPAESGNSWIDAAITAELEAMRPPELPGTHALESGVTDAVIIDATD